MSELVRTLRSVLGDRAQRNSDAPFVHFDGRTLSYAEMDALASRSAKGLASIGIVHGARVCIALPNGVDFMAVWFGAARLGAIEVPINLEFKGPQVRYVIEDAGAEVLVTQRAFFEEHAPTLSQCKGLRTVVLTDADGSAGETGLATLRFQDLLGAAYNLEQARPVAPSDPIAILYTSGTTGMPKGVLLCHEHELTMGGNIASSIGLGASDCFYNFFPMHHNTAQGIITCAVLLVGARMLVIDRFSRTRFWDDVRAHGCTAFFGMGAILEILNKDPDGVAASKGHTLRAGWGIAMGAEQVKRFTELFGVTFVTGFGSTEVSMVAISAQGDVRPGHVGRIVKDIEVRVVDEADEPLPVGRVGEIVVRPMRPHITFLEYWGKPQETVKAWRNLWIHTGDAGYFDDDGNLYFVDRIKDVIRYRGNNVSSLEVENVLLKLPDVLEVAVVPVASALGTYEQDVRAVLIMAKGRQLDPAAIIAHCADRLPYYAVPRYLDVADALPKTSTGKVRKTELRERGLPPNAWDRVAAGINVQSQHARKGKG